VKSILFDGANSRLLVSPVHSEREMLVALPQNRQFDYIQPNDTVEIGWDQHAGICFPAQEDPV
jgi:spermidine/putrescine transport system ATP-binding protein